MVRLLHSLNDFPSDLRGGAVGIGNFDAMHLGHAELIRTLVMLSGQVGGPALVFTFNPPPGAILHPELPRIMPLTSLQRRAQLVGTLGAKALIAYPTDHAFLQLSARQFFSHIVLRTIGAKAMVEGNNFRFGKGREGDNQLLSQLCEEHGVRLHTMQLVQAQSQPISSTRVRELVTLGQISAANRMLLEPYRIEGTVVRGAERGRTIGFPTANLDSIPVLLPALGVYAGRVIGLGRTPLAAAVNIGPNPTFGEQRPKVEVHVVGWQGTLYGQSLDVELVERLRDIHKFPSVDALKEQLRRDVQQCVELTTRR